MHARFRIIRDGMVHQDGKGKSVGRWTTDHGPQALYRSGNVQRDEAVEAHGAERRRAGVSEMGDGRWEMGDVG
jgi:hypothetical protein